MVRFYCVRYMLTVFFRPMPLNSIIMRSWCRTRGVVRDSLSKSRRSQPNDFQDPDTIMGGWLLMNFYGMKNIEFGVMGVEPT